MMINYGNFINDFILKKVKNKENQDRILLDFWDENRMFFEKYEKKLNRNQ